MTSNYNGQNITLLTDEPLINDEDLSIRNKALIEVIKYVLDKCRQKIKAFAVYGNWGTGKTSVIRSVHQHFVVKNKTGELSHVLPVWFDAWRYQHEGDIYPALLREIGSAIESFVPEKKNLGKTVVKYAYAIARRAKIKTSIIELPSIEELKELKLSEQFATFGESPYFEAIKLLRKVPAELEQGEKRGHVIIFIDDLDRCLPGVAFNLIEKLKIWIDIEGYTICLALNAEEIEKVIMKYFADHLEINEESLNKVAEEYLLKICSLALYVDKNNQYLKGIMKRKIDTEKPFSGVVKTVDKKVSYRKIKSYYNITVFENLVKGEIKKLKKKNPGGN